MKNWLRGALAAVLAISLALAPARAQVADSSSSLLQLLIMGQGLHNNDWGLQTNLNLQKIENAIAASTPFTVSGGSMTLTDDQSRPAVLSFAGVLVADLTVTVPARSKSWIVLNKTSGAFALKFKTASGSPTTIPQSSTQARLFYCDSLNVFDVSAGGVPDLAANTFLANTGSGAIAATYAQVLAALGLDAAGAPEFKSLKISGAAGTDLLDVTAAGGGQVLGTLRVKGPAATARTLQFQTDASKRWTAAVNAVAESGSNAGSDFELSAFADDGTTLLGKYLTVSRATGAVSMPGPLSVGGATVTPPADGFARNLKITVTSDTAATVSASVLTLWDGSTGTKTFRNLSGSVSTACSTGVLCMDTGGPGTSRWLQVWAIGKADGTISATFTAAAAPTPPALPSGYTYYARLGAIRIDSASRVIRTVQSGRFASYVVTGAGSSVYYPAVTGGVAGNVTVGPTISASLASVVPPTASKASVVLIGGGVVIIAAPNANFGAYNSTTNPPPVSTPSGVFLLVPWTFSLETMNIFYAQQGGGINATGWEDNL